MAMSPKRLHVVIRENVFEDPKARDAAYERLTKLAQAVSLNPARYERHGILTLDVEGDAIVDALRKAPEVESIEMDDTMRAL